ncbi:hypothetical protein VTL71DRAFT_3570 [Oculimacula yallundae]|uniref:Uncharacterized protein n=1 Tax=Oculimacula yallundae TaxID=86028 RepID=A0ABR4C7K9_9HELO
MPRPFLTMFYQSWKSGHCPYTEPNARPKTKALQWKGPRRSSRAATAANTRQSRSLSSAAFTEASAPLDEPGPRSTATVGTKCGFLTFESRYNSPGKNVMKESSQISGFLDYDASENDEAALTLVRHYSRSGRLEGKQVQIRSPHIKRALGETVRAYPGVNINGDGVILADTDPWFLFHYHNELSVYCSKLKNKNAKEHVQLCLQFTMKVFKGKMSSYEATVHDQNVIPGLTFPNLWMVFKPGTLLIHGLGDEEMICLLIFYGERPRRRWN